jgi:hypothetical protein
VKSGKVNDSDVGGVLTTLSESVDEALTPSTVPEIGMLMDPATMVLDVVKKIVAPPEGTAMGNVEVVEIPAGSVPRVMLGVAEVFVTLAVTVTKNDSLGETLKEDGETERDR